LEKKGNYLDTHEACLCCAALFTIISGSFRKHLHQIVLLKQILESKKIVVLSPEGHAAVNPSEEFIILDSDPVDNPKLLQDSVFAKIRRSTFIVVANIDGYLGKAAILEIGYAIALGITVYTLEQVEDPNLQPYCRPLAEVFPDIPQQFEQIQHSPSKNIINEIRDKINCK
jgi:nucleoside 2-deoxyribosyltransferase